MADSSLTWPHGSVYTYTYAHIQPNLSQDRIHLDNDYFTPAENHRKKCGALPTHSSKGQMGSLDLHFHEAVMRNHTLPQAWYQRRPD